MLGGYIYTQEQAEALAKKLNLVGECTDFLVYPKLIRWFEKRHTQVIPIPDSTSTSNLCLFVPTQRAVWVENTQEGLSYRFKPTKDCEDFRKMYAQIFGLPSDAPFRTVIDPSAANG